MITLTQVQNAMRDLSEYQSGRGSYLIGLAATLKLYYDRGEYNGLEDSALACLQQAGYEVGCAFKPGDRVRYTGEDSGGLWVSGKVYTVSKIERHEGTYLIQPIEGQGSCRAQCFELVAAKGYGRKLPAWF